MSELVVLYCIACNVHIPAALCVHTRAAHMGAAASCNIYSRGAEALRVVCRQRQGQQGASPQLNVYEQQGRHPRQQQKENDQAPAGQAPGRAAGLASTSQKPTCTPGRLPPGGSEPPWPAKRGGPAAAIQQQQQPRPAVGPPGIIARAGRRAGGAGSARWPQRAQHGALRADGGRRSCPGPAQRAPRSPA